MKLGRKAMTVEKAQGAVIQQAPTNGCFNGPGLLLGAGYRRDWHLENYWGGDCAKI
ncbi:hypothetical protein REMIM1_PC00179 (plasmid) [Rhizobium etli bv. mimosae str. Mim1]|nr:hypothetical protein REMIM1_PC00179 [Rhizobium etli bv. mimosae str. Mim1]